MLRMSTSTSSTFLPASVALTSCRRSRIRRRDSGMRMMARWRKKAVSSNKRSGASGPFRMMLCVNGFRRSCSCGVSSRAGCKPMLRLLVGRDHVIRDVTGGEVVLQLVQDPPPADVGKSDVERDCMRSELACQRDGSRATCRHDGLEAAGVRLVDEDARECLIVLDHEENAVIRPDVVPIVVDLLRGRLDMRGGLVHRDRLLFTHPALHVDRG